MISFDTEYFELIHIDNFNPQQGSPIEILSEIGEPFCVFVPGRDASRNRVLSTLIHGNEPSGYFGFLKWLKKGVQPATNIYCFVTGVGAALTKPYLTHRVILSGKDINRCFFPPYEGYEGKLAQEFLRLLAVINPEAIVDIHNTSGNSPDFGISIHQKPVDLILCSMFTSKCLIIKLNLGTMVEMASEQYDCVTIECGNANHPMATEIALRGISTFFEINLIQDFQSKTELSILKHPIRLELKHGHKVVYTKEPKADASVIMPPDIDKLNSERLEPGAKIGIVPSNSFDIFNFAPNHPAESIHDYFYIQDKTMYAKHAMHLIMVTTNPIIAQNDCLFYVVKDTADA